jgi:hypothetical protein
MNRCSGAFYPESTISIGCGEICRASKPEASSSEMLSCRMLRIARARARGATPQCPRSPPRGGHHRARLPYRDHRLRARNQRGFSESLDLARYLPAPGALAPRLLPGSPTRLSVRPETVKPAARQLGVPDRVLNVPVPEIVLRPSATQGTIRRRGSPAASTTAPARCRRTWPPNTASGIVLSRA